MNGLREAFMSWWASRLPRERQVLVVGAISLLLILWIFALIVPLSTEVKRLGIELSELRETNASLAAMEREAESLSASANSTPLPVDQRQAALERSLARAAFADAKSIEVTAIDANHLRVRCSDVDYGLWLAWLHGAKADVGASIESATVTARAANGVTGRVRAEVIFAWGEGARGAAS